MTPDSYWAAHPQQHDLLLAAMIVCFVVAVLVGIWSLYLQRPSLPRAIGMWRTEQKHGERHFIFGDWLPYRLLMPLERAAQIAYDELENSAYMQLARGLDKGGTDLRAYAVRIVVGKKVPLYGRRPPATVFSKIEGTMREHGFIEDAGRSIRNGAEKKDDVMVLRKDFKKALRLAVVNANRLDVELET